MGYGKSTYPTPGVKAATEYLEVLEFTATAQFLVDDSVAEMYIFCMGGGGAGGSGSVQAASYAGGGRGAGGGFSIRRITRQNIRYGIWTAEIGAGGVGGVAVLTDSTNGNAGTAGGDTRVYDATGSNICLAKGGGGGAGAVTSAVGTTGTSSALTNHVPSSNDTPYGAWQGAGSGLYVNTTSSGGGCLGGQATTQTNLPSGGQGIIASPNAAVSLSGKAPQSGPGGFSGKHGMSSLVSGLSLLGRRELKKIRAAGGATAGAGANTLRPAGAGGDGAFGAAGGGGGGSINAAATEPGSARGGNGGNGWVVVYLIRNVSVEIAEKSVAGTYTIDNRDGNIVHMGLHLMGAGGGGGCGYQSATNNIHGGGGGGGGCYTHALLFDLDDVEFTLDVGAGGAGATASSTADTLGGSASMGGDTKFSHPDGSILVYAKGGLEGNSSNSTVAANGVSWALGEHGFPAFQVGTGIPGVGSGTTSTGATAGTAGRTITLAAANGGNGRGLTTGTTEGNGGAGGGPVFGAGGVANAGRNGSNCADDSTTAYRMFFTNQTTEAFSDFRLIGGGGGGGASETDATTNAGNGGNGIRGGGGGGGGSGRVGNIPGNGGNGGDGQAALILYRKLR